MSFRTIEWRDDAVIMIDKTRLPGEEIYNSYTDFKSVAEAIKGMIIRGAPAIGVAAAMGIALGAREIIADTHESFFRQLDNVCDVMARTRPTAVNLFWAIERMKRVAEASRGRTLDQIRLKYADLSVALNKLLRATGVPPAFGKEVDEMHCPMYQQGQGGGTWLQLAGTVQNPYFGTRMPGCFDRRQALPVTGQSSTNTQDGPATQPADL